MNPNNAVARSRAASRRASVPLGLPFAASYHTAPANVLDVVEGYREAFRPGRLLRPNVMVSADVVVANTDERARELAAPYAQWVLDIRTGLHSTELLATAWRARAVRAA